LLARHLSLRTNHLPCEVRVSPRLRDSASRMGFRSALRLAGSFQAPWAVPGLAKGADDFEHVTHHHNKETKTTRRRTVRQKIKQNHRPRPKAENANRRRETRSQRSPNQGSSAAATARIKVHQPKPLPMSPPVKARAESTAWRVAPAAAWTTSGLGAAVNQGKKNPIRTRAAPATTSFCQGPAAQPTRHRHGQFGQLH